MEIFKVQFIWLEAFNEVIISGIGANYASKIGENRRMASSTAAAGKAGRGLGLPGSKGRGDQIDRHARREVGGQVAKSFVSGAHCMAGSR